MNISSAHISAIIAFSLWGLFPLYWKIFTELSSWDLFAHRLLWSFVTLTILVVYKRNFQAIKNIWATPRLRYMLIASAILISSNWLLYIYAISIGKVLEASMGYFLNPLLNVFMGWLLLKEKMRVTQWPSIILACIAMLIIAFQTNLQNFPWIALTLSLTFALYGLLRKIAHVGSTEGLTFETSIVIIPTMLYWFTLPSTPLTAFEILPLWKLLTLLLSGLVTCIPLVLFAFSAKRLPLRTLGFIQYLSPSLKFVCGLFILKEALTPEKLQAFCLIWIALVWYTFESFYFSQKEAKKLSLSSRNK
ncbi:MAG: EamA family transporter RarD [Bacteriovoracaceae bacterium]